MFLFLLERKNSDKQAELLLEEDGEVGMAMFQESDNCSHVCLLFARNDGNHAKLDED